MKRTFYAGLIVTWIGLAPAYGLSVDEAYRAIPHKRTVFNPQVGKMDKAEADYLMKLFNWIDLGIIAKMTTMRTQTSVEEAYKPVWEMESKLVPPAKLKELQKTVSQSIHNEYAYLKEWRRTTPPSFNAGHPNVQAASRDAHQAYGQLMSTYPSEDSHNKQAFFDYLCALDFL